MSAFPYNFQLYILFHLVTIDFFFPVRYKIMLSVLVFLLCQIQNLFMPVTEEFYFNDDNQNLIEQFFKIQWLMWYVDVLKYDDLYDTMIQDLENFGFSVFQN